MNEVQGFQALVSTGSLHPYTMETARVAVPVQRRRREDAGEAPVGGGGAVRAFRPLLWLLESTPPGLTKNVLMQKRITSSAFNLNLLLFFGACATTNRRPKRRLRAVT